VDDDGANNQTSWNKIVAQSKNDTRIKGIKLSKNFGQHHAITAGLNECKGEWIIVLDCDLQDRPEEIPNLYIKAIEGYDIVYARRKIRQDSMLKKLYSFCFYKIFEWLTGVSQDSAITNFGIYSASVIKALNEMKEPLRAFGIMVKWVGFKSTSIDVIHAERLNGKSNYNFKKLINLAIDISISFSDKPLKFTIKLGALISVISFVFGLYNLISALNGKFTQPGFASLIISIWFLSGLIIFTLGVIGLYLGKVFDGVKQRPLYIIHKKVNL
jgi:dolichol-phosphate mannosyltransferase